MLDLQDTPIGMVTQMTVTEPIKIKINQLINPSDQESVRRSRSASYERHALRCRHHWQPRV